MVKIEGIYKGKERIGQELLLDEKWFHMFFGRNGSKERFFEKLDEEVDFSLFLHYTDWIKKVKPSGFTFINIKPVTLIRFKDRIRNLLEGKVVLEVREDRLSEEEALEIAKIREDFPFLLSVDDFGRGASNLDRVAVLRPNFVKVDISLFSRSKDLVNLVTFLKEYAGKRMVLIAEKVERKEDLRMARGAGIELWQGWYEREWLKHGGDP